MSVVTIPFYAGVDSSTGTASPLGSPITPTSFNNRYALKITLNGTILPSTGTLGGLSIYLGAPGTGPVVNYTYVGSTIATYTLTSSSGPALFLYNGFSNDQGSNFTTNLDISPSPEELTSFMTTNSLTSVQLWMFFVSTNAPSFVYYNGSVVCNTDPTENVVYSILMDPGYSNLAYVSNTGWLRVTLQGTGNNINIATINDVIPYMTAHGSLATVPST